MTDATWTSWQKIAFRFFFPFLTLQVLTENFLGNLFGNTVNIWRLGEKIFVDPCRWLNRQIFHFAYHPPAWTSFSASLHTIRDMVYLLLAIFICVTWSLVDKSRPNYNKLHYWFSRSLVVPLSCITFCYGMIKVIPVQMSVPSFFNLYTPLGQHSPFNLLWYTYGIGKPYQIFTGCCEVVGAICILFHRTRVLGLLLISMVMMNVILLNYTYQIGVLVTSFYVLLVALFLLAPSARILYSFFTSGRPDQKPPPAYIPARTLGTRIFGLASALVVSACFIGGIRVAYVFYIRSKEIASSRHYSLVTNFLVDGDTLKPVENDTVRWRIYSELVRDGKPQVTIGWMKPGLLRSYALQRDTGFDNFTLRPVNPLDRFIRFHKADGNPTWIIDGMLGSSRIRAVLKRVNPDTLFPLLNSSRAIIPLDDGPGAD